MVENLNGKTSKPETTNGHGTIQRGCKPETRTTIRNKHCTNMQHQILALEPLLTAGFFFL